MAVNGVQRVGGGRSDTQENRVEWYDLKMGVFSGTKKLVLRKAMS
jgi:hypothetical protein